MTELSAVRKELKEARANGEEDELRARCGEVEVEDAQRPIEQFQRQFRMPARLADRHAAMRAGSFAFAGSLISNSSAKREPSP